MRWLDSIPDALPKRGLFVARQKEITRFFASNPLDWQCFGRGGVDCIRRGRVTISTPERLFPGFACDGQASIERACNRIKAMCNYINVPYKSPSTPMEIARAIMYPLRDVLKKHNVGMPGRHANEAFFGGKIITLQKEGDGLVSEWDIYKAYPSCLGWLPGGPAYALPPELFLCAGSDMIELWHCEVELPPTKIGLLPFRDRGGVFYPHGKYKGSWWSCELNVARDNGAKIKPLYGWGWYGTDAGGWILPALREAESIFEDCKTLLKKVSVGIVGSLAMQPSNYTQIHTLDPPLGAIPVNIMQGLYKIKEKGAKKPPVWARRHVASYIQASVRSELTAAAFALPKGSIISLHTDGILVAGDATIERRGWRKKKQWNGEWHAPYNGAFFAGRKRVRAPGLKTETTQEKIEELLGC